MEIYYFLVEVKQPMVLAAMGTLSTESAPFWAKKRFGDHYAAWQVTLNYLGSRLLESFLCVQSSLTATSQGFPKLHHIDLEFGTDFYAGDARSISVDMLLICLMERCERKADVLLSGPKISKDMIVMELTRIMIMIMIMMASLQGCGYHWVRFLLSLLR
jgi:hypothetical protein